MFTTGIWRSILNALTNQAGAHSFSTVRTPETMLWLCMFVSLKAFIAQKAKTLFGLVESNSNDTIRHFRLAMLHVAITLDT